MNTAYTGKSAMRMSPSKTLRAARTLITDVSLWTQRARARNSSYRRCPPNDPAATQWSLNGAIAIVSNPQGVTPPYLLRRLDLAVIEMGLVQRLFPQPGEEWAAGCFEIWESCDDFNDNRTHADVLELMDITAQGLQEAGW